MDAKQFLAEFGHIAGAPGGIASLRELISIQAVRGELVVQNPTDSPVSDKVFELQKRREELVKNKEIKPITGTRKLSKNELLEPIPVGWRWEQIYRVVKPVNYSIKRGPFGSAIKKAYFISSGYKVYEQKHAINDDFSLGHYFISKERFDALQAFEVKPNDIIISCSGTVGRVAVAPEAMEPGIINQALLKLSLDGSVINFEYFKLVFPTYFMKVEMLSDLKGTAQKNMVPIKELKNIPFPLPPLEEQSRIVAKVDELMALCDKLEIQQQQKRKLQNHLRQSTLQALTSAESPKELQSGWECLSGNFLHLFAEKSDVTSLRELIVDLAIKGLLVKEDFGLRALQEGPVFIGEIKKKKSGRCFAKIKQPKQVFKLHRNWSWVLLEDLLSGSESGWSPKCDSEPRQGEEWGVLKVSAVTWGKFNHTENKRLPLSLEAREVHEVVSGDFLLSRANSAELVARSVVVPDDCPEKLMMSDKIVRLNFTEGCVKEWVNLVNNSSYARAYYRKRATGTSDSMRNVSRQVIHELPVPFPPVCEQTLILKKVELLIEFCDTLEEKLLVKNKTAKHLAIATIASLTGITTPQQEAPMKAPKTELIAPVRLGKVQPIRKTKAPLATLLTRHNGEMSANDLWQRYGGEIDTFYAQLKTEVSHGWVTEPTSAKMLEKEADE